MIIVTSDFLFPCSIEQSGYTVSDIRRIEETTLLLEGLRHKNISHLVFASSGGTVYGETDKFPTPESIPFKPISNYGAAKTAVEMYLSSYAELYRINSVAMRFGISLDHVLLMV